MNIKAIIEKIVHQEIQNILAENEISIREIVEASLVSELKATRSGIGLQGHWKSFWRNLLKALKSKPLRNLWKQMASGNPR